MIEMNKEYLYRNGEKARILCVDRPSEIFPVVSMNENGAIMTHTADGRKAREPEGYAYDLLPHVFVPQKATWCQVWDGNGDSGCSLEPMPRLVVGYHTDSVFTFPYRDANGVYWQHAEPCDPPEWANLPLMEGGE